MDSRPASSTKSQTRDYSTGFPEPFCGTGNTTLRHPDADTSPNATFSSNMDMEHTYIRSRRSFLSRRRAASYGKISVSNMEPAADMSAGAPSPTLTEDSSKFSDCDNMERPLFSSASLMAKDHSSKPLPPTTARTTRHRSFLHRFHFRG